MKTISTIVFALFLTFNLAIAQDTLYLYKSGTVVNKRAIAKIDSIVFYKADTSTQGNTVTDIDGNVYHTLTIGAQVWMVENLKVTHYRNGDAINYVTDNTSWSGLTTGAYCWYNNDEASYKSTYGALYNWYVVSDSHNLCPAGWHVPTDEDWTNLIVYLGGEPFAGGKLKESGLTHWNSPNVVVTNETGFYALPGGDRFYDGSYNLLGSTGYWWSATEISVSNARFNNILNTDISIGRFYLDKKMGFSIRCIHD